MALQPSNIVGVEDLVAARRVLEQMAQEQRESSMGKILSALLHTGGILEIGAKIAQCRESCKQMNNMADLAILVENGQILTEDKVTDVISGTGLTWVKTKADKFKELLCFGEKCNTSEGSAPESKVVTALRKQFATDLRKSQTEMAETTVQNSAISSGFIIIIQFVKLYIVFGDISLAKNLSKEVEAQLEIIGLELTEIANEVSNIANLIHQSETAADSGLGLIARRVQLLTSQCNRKIGRIGKRIKQMEVQVGRQTEKIGLQRDGEVLDGIANLCQCVAATVQYFNLGGFLPTGYKIVQGGIATGFFLLTAGNTYAFVMTGKTLEVLRARLRSIDAMAVDIDKLHEIIDQAEAWLLRTLPLPGR